MATTWYTASSLQASDCQVEDVMLTEEFRGEGAVVTSWLTSNDFPLQSSVPDIDRSIMIHYYRTTNPLQQVALVIVSGVLVASLIYGVLSLLKSDYIGITLGFGTCFTFLAMLLSMLREQRAYA